MNLPLTRARLHTDRSRKCWFWSEVNLESRHEEGSPGYASDLAIRLDLINLEITETSSEPEIVTPAIHLSTNLRVYDSQGEQDWLHGDLCKQID